MPGYAKGLEANQPREDMYEHYQENAQNDGAEHEETEYLDSELSLEQWSDQEDEGESPGLKRTLEGIFSRTQQWTRTPFGNAVTTLIAGCAIGSMVAHKEHLRFRFLPTALLLAQENAELEDVNAMRQMEDDANRPLRFSHTLPTHNVAVQPEQSKENSWVQGTCIIGSLKVELCTPNYFIVADDASNEKDTSPENLEVTLADIEAPTQREVVRSYSKPTYTSFTIKDIKGSSEAPQQSIQHPPVTVDTDKVLTDPVARNLLTPTYECLKPAQDIQRFKALIDASITHPRPYDPEGWSSTQEQVQFAKVRQLLLQSGNVNEFVTTVQDVVSSNMHYDQLADSWLKCNEDGSLQMKEGKGNFEVADASADGISVDELLCERHNGVCRHFAEAFSMVAEELKKEYPGKFDNIFVVPITSGYQWHEEVAIYQKVAPDKLEMVVYEPQGVNNDSQSQASVFDFLNTLRARNGITEATFYNLVGDYFAGGGSEIDINIKEFLRTALDANTPESLAAVKKVVSYLDALPNSSVNTQRKVRIREGIRKEYGEVLEQARNSEVPSG